MAVVVEGITLYSGSVVLLVARAGVVVSVVLVIGDNDSLQTDSLLISQLIVGMFRSGQNKGSLD